MNGRLRTAFTASLLAIFVFALLTPVRAQEGREPFERGVALYNQKKYDAALEAFAAARKAAPDNPLVLYWIGFVNLQEKRYADALEPLERAVQLDPKSADAYLNLGNVYDGLKRYPEAVKTFQKVTVLQPKSPDPLYNLGSVYFKMKNWTEAATAYRKASVLAPNDPFVQEGLGAALRASGDLMGAIAAHERAAKLDPNNVSLWLSLGLAAQAQAAQSKAAPAVRAKARETALSALSRAAKLAPDNYAARETYGEALFDAGKFVEAVPQFEKAAVLDAKQFYPRFNLGLSLARLGRGAEAIKAYQAALEVAPPASAQAQNALRTLGGAQFQRKQFKEAAETFARVVQTEPADLETRLNLSLSLQRGGDNAAALTVLEEGTKQPVKGPRIALIRRALAAALYTRGDADSVEKAREQYALALQDEPNSPDTLNGLGLIAQKQNKPDEAVKLFQQAVALRPRFADAYNNLGVACEAKGDAKAALAAYRKALEVDPKHPLAKKNLASLEKVAGVDR